MVRRSSGLPAFLGHPSKLLPPLFIIYTCFKVLLIPTYRSTDFDVHRNWLAITLQLPLSEWYFDDMDGGTVHTLDYPPAFAFFEYLLSHNPIADVLRLAGDRCFELLPDSDNTPSEACIAYQRGTVIASDVVLWAGAYLACQSVYHKRPPTFIVSSFLLIVFNPGLLWLDHIHFQYNGMLLGVLLASLGCFMMANNVKAAEQAASAAATTTGPDGSFFTAYDFYTLSGAALYALLLNLKHLYLPLAPLFFCYLLERYCLSPRKKRLLVRKFLLLALVTGTTLLLPWVPFLLVDPDNPSQQVFQILSRLFPFGRGLLHDYWAANVWAIYALANRVFQFVVRRLVETDWPGVYLLDGMDLPEPSPTVCAVILFFAIIPAMQVASARLTNLKLVEAVVYVSLCAFMLAYHVHEKAIMTTLLPLAILVESSPRAEYHNLLFWHVSIWGLLGLFPLLFRPVELLFKLCTYVLYLALASFLLGMPPKWTMEIQSVTFGLVVVVVAVLEVVPIQGKWEFLPLMATSVMCAFGLVGCWGVSLWLLSREEKPVVGRGGAGPGVVGIANAGSASPSSVQ
jgi:alpha-1,3-glucosyltransferase